MSGNSLNRFFKKRLKYDATVKVFCIVRLTKPSEWASSGHADHIATRRWINHLLSDVDAIAFVFSFY